MNVYLYQNNTEKILKNAYIGEYTGVFELDYDFRNKSVSQLTSDGFTFPEGSDYLAFNSTGMYKSSGNWYGNSKPCYLSPISPANIRKITISTYVYFASDTENTIYFYRNISSNIASWYTSPLGSSNGVNYFDTSANASGNMSGWRTKTIELDLVNKKVKFTCPEVSYSAEYSITDANVATFRGLTSSGIIMGIAKSGAYIQSCKMIIE